MPNRDYRTTPVRRLVVVGESNAYGMGAGDPLNEWVQALAFLIRRFQDGPLRVWNNSIPSNLISPRAPAYDPAHSPGLAPSALERFRTDMVEYRPDLAIYAYGFNDSRCGHAVSSFIGDYEQIVAETRRSLPDSLIVLVGPYWALQFDPEYWARVHHERRHSPAFSLVGDELVLAYNAAIAELADRHGALFVNVYRVLEGAGWLLPNDIGHFSDLGHWLIGQTVFATLATRCSFLATKSINALREVGYGVQVTGGTGALPRVINRWRRLEEWRE